MPAMLAAISASVSSGRWLVLSDGSPTLVVPPPISTIGLWPVCCMRRSAMIWTRLPTCSDDGGGVEADVAGDGPLAGRGVKALEVGRLVDVAALDQGPDEIRLGLERRWGGFGGHGRNP